MKPSILQLLKPELAPDEQILWSSKPSIPQTALAAIPAVVFGSIFLISPFEGKFIQSVVRVSELGETSAKVISVLLGTVILARTFLAVLATRSTAYAITNRRILIVHRLLGRRVRSFGPEDINTLEQHIRRDGSGALTFRKEYVNGIDAGGLRKFKFSGIQNVADAAQALETFRGQGRTANSANGGSVRCGQM